MHGAAPAAAAGLDSLTAGVRRGAGNADGWCGNGFALPRAWRCRSWRESFPERARGRNYLNK